MLAGGAGRRLGGRDKPGLPVGGRPMLDRVLAAVPDAARVVVVGPRRATAREVTWTREEPPGGGPVPALAAGLRLVTAADVVVLAADLPFLDAPTVSALRGAAADRGAVLVDDAGRAQWLVAAWPAARLRAALVAPAGGALRHVLAPLGPVPVVPPERAAGLPPWYDCDTPEQLETAEANDVNPLDRWLAAVAADLGVDDTWSAADRDLLLDLTRDVAHDVARPAAPLTAYLAGLAVGRGEPVPAVMERVRALAAAWSSTERP